MSPPYCNLILFSLYVFNYDFYNNKDIINSNISFKDTVYSIETNRQAKHLYKVHKAIINNSKLNDEFEPMDMPSPPRLIRAHLSDDCNIEDLGSFFIMFIRDP